MTLLCCIAAALVSGCTPDGAGCTTGLGPQETEVRLLPDGLDRLLVDDRIHVVWTPSDTVPHAIVRAGAGVLAGVRIEADGSSGLARVVDFNGCHWVRRLDAVPEVELVGCTFREILLQGQGDFSMGAPLLSGDLRVEGNEMAGRVGLMFMGDTLTVRMPNGIGHVHAEGEAIRLRAFRSGFGDLDARDLTAGQVMVHHAGLGEVHLRAPGYLFLEMAGHGNAVLHGPGDLRDIRHLDGATGEVIEWP